MPRAALLKRLHYLWTFELLNGVVMLPLLLITLSGVLSLGLLTALMGLLLCSYLCVGAAFWYLKFRDVEHETQILPRTRGIFRRLKVVFAGTLFISAIGLAIFSLMNGPSHDWLMGLVLYSVAVLEHINYFHWQLMYDNRADWRYVWQHRRLKRATMVRLLDI